MAPPLLDLPSAEVLARELADLGCEALLVVADSARDPDLAPFVGPVHLGRAFLVLPRPPHPDRAPAGGPMLGFLTPMERGEAARTGLALLTPDALEVERLSREVPEPGAFWGALLAKGLELAGVPAGRIALAGHPSAGVAVELARRLAAAGRPAVGGDQAVRLLRKRKNRMEIDDLRRAAGGTVAALRRVAEVLAAAAPSGPDGTLRFAGEPLTVGRLRREVFRVLSAHGLEQPEAAILAPAEEGAMPHSIGSDERVLRAGESLVADLFPRSRLFADCTRTFCVGEPPEALARAHAAVREALEAARRGARPGVRGWSLQEAACAYLRELGYETPISHPGTERGYVHNLGHGVGFELHEYPSFRKEAGAEGVLAAGDVITLEPGLYDLEARWAVRLEDQLVLGEDGIAEDLTPLPYELDPRAWTQRSTQ